MEESMCKCIKKSLNFEKSGETLSVEIRLENVSPETNQKTLLSFLDTIYQSAKDVIFK